MKLVTRGKIRHPILNHLFVSDLDRLGEIATASLAASDSELVKLAEEFTSIIVHLRIGSFHKRTGSGRLGETERVLAHHLKAVSGEIEILDVGASDGVTTRQLVEALEKALGRSCRAIAMDLYQTLVVFEGAGRKEYRTADGMPVMVRNGPFALPLPESKDSRDLVRNWMARRYMSNRSKAAAMHETGRVRLVSPWVQRSRKIEALEQSILVEERSWVGRFHAIRACNVLNPRFFSIEERSKILGYCHGYLKERGLLLISRNHIEAGRETERGTLWRRSGEGFVPVDRFGGGSEIQADVSAFRAARRDA
jgi:hypothetical protein